MKVSAALSLPPTYYFFLLVPLTYCFHLVGIECGFLSKANIKPLSRPHLPKREPMVQMKLNSALRSRRVQNRKKLRRAGTTVYGSWDMGDGNDGMIHGQISVGDRCKRLTKGPFKEFQGFCPIEVHFETLAQKVNPKKISSFTIVKNTH